MNRWTKFEAEIQKAKDAMAEQRTNDAWQALELAHVLGQPRISPHLRTHWLMFLLACQLRDTREVFGQLARFLLVIPGTLLGRLPLGNTGRSRVSAFQPMEAPEEIRPFLQSH